MYMTRESTVMHGSPNARYRSNSLQLLVKTMSHTQPSRFNDAFQSSSALVFLGQAGVVTVLDRAARPGGNADLDLVHDIHDAGSLNFLPVITS